MQLPPLMKKIAEVHLEYLKQKAPGLAQAVAHAKVTATGATVSLAAFRGDLGLLYAFLWYAESEDVPVTFQQHKS